MLADQKSTAKDLEKKLDQAAVILRKSLNASENYKLVLPLLFVKRLNDNFIERAERMIKDENLSREEAYENEKRHTNLFVPRDASYKKLQGASSKVGTEINKVFKVLEQSNKDLEGTLVNAEFANTDKYPDDALRKIVSIFAEEDISDSNLENEDAFGDAYEFLLEEYAGETKKKGGQFYTPRQVVRLMVNLVKPEPGMRICDPTCGSGGMLIQSRKYIEKNFPENDPNNLTLEGQESNPDTVNLGKMNMVIHKINDFTIKPKDVLETPGLLEDGKLRTYDRVLANFPFSEDWDNSGKENDEYDRFVYGIPPSKNKADFAFIQHMLACLNEDGIAAIVASQGVLFRGKKEKEIRQKLLLGDKEKNLTGDIVEAIIALPSAIFYGTPIPGCIIIINKQKPKNRRKKILFIYAANKENYQEGKVRNVLREKDLEKILKTYDNYLEEDQYSHIATEQEIIDNDFSFNVPKYVDTSMPEENINLKEKILEISKMDDNLKNIHEKFHKDLKNMGMIK
jgi:type I restriction enzyme M protein